MSFDLKGIFKAGTEKVIAATGKALDDLITNKEEREAAKLALQAELNRHAEALANDSTKQLELVLSDKQSAREMFKVNSSLQKIYAIVFLAAYVILSGAMCYMIYVISIHKINLPDWGIGFISTIWGAMSMKVGTVTDFLFGASMTPEKK